MDAAPDILLESTEIPNYPDQEYFCELWLEHHRGYRVTIDENGEEELVPLVGEPWNNVEPGHLPRTLAEVEYGTASSREIEADEAASLRRLRAIDDRSPADRLRAVDNQSSVDRFINILENELARRPPAPQPPPQPRPTVVIEEQQQVFTIEEVQRMRQAYANFAHPRPIGLDVGVHPEALRDEQMRVDLSCGICYQQIANIVCLPCGHVAMCLWCADMTVPTRVQDPTRPLHSDAACPICRKEVTQRVSSILLTGLDVPLSMNLLGQGVLLQLISSDIGICYN
jgi:hypothetical protein